MSRIDENNKNLFFYYYLLSFLKKTAFIMENSCNFTNTMIELIK